MAMQSNKHGNTGYSEHGDCFEAFAPDGYVFKASGTHSIVSSFSNKERGGLINGISLKDRKKSARADIKERLAYGIELCENSQCMWCDSKEEL